MKKRRVQPRNSDSDASYPARQPDVGSGCAAVDVGRRRFLKHVGAISGGLGAVTALGGSASAQNPEPHFRLGLLRHHPTTAELAAESASGSDKHHQKNQSQPEDASAGGVPDNGGDPRFCYNPDHVAEDRSLWLEPGYILLVRISRPPGDLSVVERFEAAAPVVQSYLSANIASADQLHDLIALHRHEAELASLIAAAIVPGVVEVLHLDHDCLQVCSTFPPSVDVYSFDYPLPLGGVAPSPDW